MQLLPHLIVKYEQGILVLTGAWVGEYPRSIPADGASRIIPPTHRIANRHQLRQDATDSGSEMPPPCTLQVLITSRKGNQSLSEEMDKCG